MTDIRHGGAALPETVASFAAQHPQKTALIINDRPLSYQGLVENVEALAARLAMAGVHAGDRVIVGLDRKQDYVEALLASLALGAVPVPVLGSADEVSTIAADSEAKLILIDQGLQEAVRAAGSDNAAIVDVAGLPTGGAPIPPRKADPDDLAMLVYTSGTTSGVRRGVMLSHQALASVVAYLNDAMALESDVIELVVAPLHHSFGLGRLRAVLSVGGTAVLQDGAFNAAAICVALEDHNCNALSSVSTGFSILADRFQRFFKPVAGQLRWAELGSLPLSLEHKRMLRELAPEARIFMHYGLTEASRSTLLDFAHTNKLDSVGRAASGNEIVIVDPQNRPLPAGETGRILVKGGNQALGYWQRSESWAKKLVSGFVDTGDLGWLDQDGYLYFVGRQDDVINVGGEKVAPVEIEDALRPLLPGVDFAVAGVRDPKGVLGQVPALFVEGAATPSLDQVRGVLTNLAPFKVPHYVEAVDSLPKTGSGKVIRSQLKLAGS